MGDRTFKRFESFSFPVSGAVWRWDDPNGNRRCYAVSDIDAGGAIADERDLSILKPKIWTDFAACHGLAA